MAVGAAAVLVRARLRCGHQPAGIFNRACTQQRVPVRLPRRHGKGGWNRQDRCPGATERLEQRRKTHVVADRQPELADRRFDEGRPWSWDVARRFAPAFSRWQINVEQVELVVMRGNLACCIDDEPAIGPARFLAVALYSQRAKMNPDSCRSRGRPYARQHEIITLAHHMVRSARAVRIEQSGHFGRKQHHCPLRRSIGNRGLNDGRIGCRVDARRHLEQADLHPAANNRSSSPERSAAARSSDPPT